MKSTFLPHYQTELQKKRPHFQAHIGGFIYNSKATQGELDVSKFLQTQNVNTEGDRKSSLHSDL